MNEAVNFIRNKLTSVPVPPNEGLSEEQIYEQQQQTERRARERQEKMEKLKRKKEEEEDEDSDYRASRIEDEDEDYQTPYAKEEQREKPQESRFMKIKTVVHDKLDSAGEAIKAGGERAYARSKQGTAEFVKDVKSDFNKALQHKPQQRHRRSAAKPLVSPAARERSADFAIRDYERRHAPKPANSSFSLSDDNSPSRNPYIGFSDMTGFGELDRGAFSLDSSQFGFSLIGDSGMFNGQQFANEQPFAGFNVKQEHSFKVGYAGEFGAFRHTKNEEFSFIPKPPHKPKNPHKRKTIKRKKSSRDFDISRLIF